MNKNWLFLLLLCLVSVPSYSQMTRVRGAVTDAVTGEPVPFVSVYFKNTTIGISTDLEGRYYIETADTAARVLTASILGYSAQERPVSRGSFNEIDFVLEPYSDELRSAVVKPDNRRIRRILDALDRSRARNDYEMDRKWATRCYVKTELDATHAEELVSSALFRNALESTIQYRDTSVVTGQTFIPILFSETISERTHGVVGDGLDQERIIANKITGFVEEDFMRPYSGTYLLNTNIYKNTIRLFNLDIPSPISRNGHPFYNYYLVDSLNIDGRKTYCLRFHPKKYVSSPTLDGEVTFDAEDYGIRSVHVSLSGKSNVNWIRSINLDTDFYRLDSGFSFPANETLFIDFSIAVSDSSKVISFLANRHTHYDVPVTDSDALKSPAGRNRVVDSGETGSDEFWTWNRPVPLTARETGLVEMIETTKAKAAFKTLHGVARSLIVGYVEPETAKIGIGPIFKTVLYNSTEGLHVGTGFRTTRNFSTKVRLSATAGYGFRDRKPKGTFGMEYVFNRDVTRKLTLSGSYDYEQLGAGNGQLTGRSIFNSFVTTGGGDRQTLLEKYSLLYEHEVTSDFSLYLDASSSRIYGNEMVPLTASDGSPLKSVCSNQVRLTARFSHDERVTRGVFDKAHIFTRYPVLYLSVTKAFKGLLKNDTDFTRADVVLDWHASSGALGFGSIHVDAGAIFGDVPYPLLKLHSGNQSIFFDKNAFNCLDYYELTSDRWVEVFYEHNLNGLLLSKIPLISGLDLREVAGIRCAYGSLAKSPMKTPYVEVSAGISNIFRIMRVDANWRLTHRGTRNFVVTIGTDLQF